MYFVFFVFNKFKNKSKIKIKQIIKGYFNESNLCKKKIDRNKTFFFLLRRNKIHCQICLKPASWLSSLRYKYSVLCICVCVYISSCCLILYQKEIIIIINVALDTDPAINLYIIYMHSNLLTFFNIKQVNLHGQHAWNAFFPLEVVAGRNCQFPCV